MIKTSTSQYFHKINKSAGLNNREGGNFSSKLINMAALLFGTLEVEPDMTLLAVQIAWKPGVKVV